MAVTLIASVTNTGRQRHANQLLNGKSFQITHFEAGSEGHDPGDPLVAIPPDPSITELPGIVFGPEPVDSSGLLSPTCPFWDATIETSEANGTYISSIALIATIVYNGIDVVDEVGDQFIYAVAHFPRNPKTSADRMDFVIGVQA